MVENPPANSGDMGVIPGSGRSLGGGNGNPLRHSCLGNPMDRGAWWATVHRVQRVDEVLEKTLESPLDCKEIQPGNPKGN